MAFTLLSTFILFLSILKCKSDTGNSDKDNTTVPHIISDDDTLNANENLPKQEALSFLRPTIVRSPPSLHSKYDQMSSFSEIDRSDTVYSPRYINPIPINREFGSVPYGYRTVPLRRATTYYPGMKRSRPRKVNSDSSIDPYDEAFLGQGYQGYPQKTSDHFSSVTEPSTLYLYEGERATLGGSDLFRYVAADEFGERFDPYDANLEFVEENDGEAFVDPNQQNEEGSLQAALKSLWKYKKLAYQTLLARSGSIDKEMMRNSDDQRSWSRAWKPPRDPKTRANRRFSQTYQNNMPFGDPLGRTYTESQKPSQRRNPIHTPRKRPSNFAINIKKHNSYTPYRRYPSDTVKRGQEGQKGYHLAPRYTDAGYTTTLSPYMPIRNPYYKGDRLRDALFDDGISVTRGGNLRTPRMQLVKQINKPTDDDKYKEDNLKHEDNNESYDDDDADNDDDDEVHEDDDKDETSDAGEVLILNVALVSKQGEEENGNEYYAYYVDDDDMNNAIDRMDVDSDFYYYDENDDEVADEDVDRKTDGGGYVEFEYVNDEEHDDNVDGYDDHNYVYSSAQNVDEEGSEEEAALSKRQGLFDFSLFGGKKKKNVKKKRIRPPYHPGTHPRPTDVTPSPTDESLPPLSNNSSKTKNIRVRIRGKPSKKRKKIRMKIMGVQDPAGSGSGSGSEPHFIVPPKDIIYNEKDNPAFVYASDIRTRLYGPPTRPMATGNPNQMYHGNQYVKTLGGATTKGYSTTFKKVHLNTGIGGPMIVNPEIKKTSGFGIKKFPNFLEGTKNAGFGGINTGYGNTKNTGYGSPMTSGYEGTVNMGYGDSKHPGIKDSVGWSAVTQMSDNLPDLNKAITVMSFIAFSIFVANLGVNAIANSSLGIQFGRNDPSFFSRNPDFNLEQMIQNLDSLFETEENLNGTRVSTFQKITDFVTVVYNDLYETTRLEMENVRDKISNFLERNFSDDDLPVGDISKGFLARQLEVGQPFGALEDTCYRRLLCLAHNLTMKYKKDDKRNQLLPFWTFGIGWLKGGESNIGDLLENLRAELAGQNKRNCRKLFSGCGNEILVEELIEEVKTELKEESDSNIELEIDVTKDNTQNYDNIVIKTTTHKSNIQDKSVSIELNIDNINNKEY